MYPHVNDVWSLYLVYPPPPQPQTSTVVSITCGSLRSPMALCSFTFSSIILQQEQNHSSTSARVWPEKNNIWLSSLLQLTIVLIYVNVDIIFQTAILLLCSHQIYISPYQYISNMSGTVRDTSHFLYIQTN